MSLILYPSNEINFDTNGLGILTDAIDDEVYEELNGQFEFSMRYPVDGMHFSEIVADAYITAKPNPVSDPQPFRIYRITKPMSGFVTVYARHAAYKNRKIAVSPFKASSAPAAMLALKTNAVNECPFEFWTDKTTAAEMNVPVPSNIWTLLGSSRGSILDVYGGEYEFDKFTVRLWNQRGADRGVSIRYGKNLTDLTMDENIANCYTGVYPYWTSLEGDLVTLPEKYISGPGQFEEENILALDLSEKFETAPTEEQLRNAAETYIENNDIGTPSVSWTVSFVQLEQTEEYKGKALLERVLLGDTVNVIFPKLNVDVDARAVAIRYCPTLGRYKSVSLGRVRANLATTIVNQGTEMKESVNSLNSKTKRYEIAKQRLTSLMAQSFGVFKTEETLVDGSTVYYMHDKPILAESQNIWKMTGDGLAVSSNGGQTWNAGLDASGNAIMNILSVIGIEASWINVDNLTALSANLGGWTVDSKAIYKDVADAYDPDTVYRVYFQPPITSSAERTWILSCQKSTNGGKSFIGIFILFSDGTAQFGESGGNQILINGENVEFWSSNKRRMLLDTGPLASVSLYGDERHVQLSDNGLTFSDAATGTMLAWLYAYANDNIVLKVDSLSASKGATGTFYTNSGKLVNVANGIITSIT